MQIDGRVVLAAVAVIVLLTAGLYYTYARTEKKLDLIVKILEPTSSKTKASKEAMAGDFDL